MIKVSGHTKLGFDFNSFINRPEKFLQSDINALGSRIFFLLRPKLAECACGFFDRFQNSRRKDIEDTVISYVTSQYKGDENFSLRLLSFGAGNLLQDFIILCKLINLQRYQSFSLTYVDMGYKQLFTEAHITIDSKGTFFKKFSFNFCRVHADDYYEGKIDPFAEIKKFPAISNFIELLQLIAAEFNVTIELHFYNNIYQVNQPDDNLFHVITAIDYLTGFEDINEISTVHKLLSPDALFFLSVEHYNFIFNKDCCIKMDDFFIDDELPNSINAIIDDISNSQVPHQNGTIHYTQLSSSYAAKIIEWLYILPGLSKQSNCTTIHLNYVVDGSNKITAENLAYFLKLFLAPTITLSIQIIHSLQGYIAQKEQIVTDIMSLLYYDEKANSMKTDPELELPQLLIMLKNICSPHRTIGTFEDTWKSHNGTILKFSMSDPSSQTKRVSKYMFGSESHFQPIAGKKEQTQKISDKLNSYWTRRKKQPEYKQDVLGLFGFFSLNMSRKQKEEAVDALKSALQGNPVKLQPHLPAYRNGELSTEIRDFVKGGGADAICDKAITTVEQFIAALDEANNPSHMKTAPRSLTM